VKYEIRIGTPNRKCASCGKPFTSARKRHEMRLYEVTDFPLVFSLYVCRHCRDLCRRGGDAKEGILAAVQATFAGWGK
jgi:hypothetical protein